MSINGFIKILPNFCWWPWLLLEKMFICKYSLSIRITSVTCCNFLHICVYCDTLSYSCLTMCFANGIFNFYIVLSLSFVIISFAFLKLRMSLCLKWVMWLSVLWLCLLRCRQVFEFCFTCSEADGWLNFWVKFDYWYIVYT